MAQRQTDDPYSMDAAFERQMVTLACSKPKFFGRTAFDVNPALLGSEIAKLALEAARAIFHDTKRGPESLLMVIQRLQTWRYEGKVTQEKVIAVSDYFDEALDAGIATVEGIEAELLPILKRRIDKQVALAAADAYGKKQEFDNVISLIERKARLGVNDQSVGWRLGPQTLKEMAIAHQVVTLPTGVDDLDTALGGGIPRGSLLVWVAGPGGGKSMALSHSASHSLRCGHHVVYATLELPESIVAARVMANLTGIPINDLLSCPEKVIELMSRIDRLGSFTVKSFTPHATSVEDIADWVKSVEATVGAPVDKLQIDYLDKCVSFATKAQAGNDYISMREVYEKARIYGVDRNIVVETASQSQGRSEKKSKKIDLEHTADSMHKVRVADIVVTNNYDEDSGEMGFWIAKHRTGDSRKMVGPLPTDFKCGAVAPVNRAFVPLADYLAKVKAEGGDPNWVKVIEDVMITDASGALQK